jgi:hypothetical protein
VTDAGPGAAPRSGVGVSVRRVARDENVLGSAIPLVGAVYSVAELAEIGVRDDGAWLALLLAVSFAVLFVEGVRMGLYVDTETGEVVVRNHVRTFRTHVDDVVAIERVWHPFAGVVLRLTDGRSLRVGALAPPNPAGRGTGRRTSSPRR